MNKFELQRQYYPVLAHRCFLNTAQNGLIPSFAQEAMTKYIENRTLNALDLERMDLLWDDSWNVRSQIGRMLNCGADEVCFGSSASDLYNIFSNGIGMKAGENIVTYDSAYFSTLFTWYNKEKEGIELRIAKNVEGVVSAESLMELCDEKTRAISICMVDFGLGYRHDVKKLGEFCRANNIYLAVDATQACGAMKIDFKDMKIDFLFTSTYKWLQGLLGLGFAVIDRPLLDTLEQTDMGWTNVKNRRKIATDHLDVSTNANKFEYGGISFVAMEGLRKVLDAYLKLGADDVEKRILGLAAYAYEKADELKSVKVLGAFPEEHRSGIVTVSYPEEWPITSEYLLERAVGAMPQGKGRTRIAMHYYNTEDDIDKFFGILKELEAGK